MATVAAPVAPAERVVPRTLVLASLALLSAAAAVAVACHVGDPPAGAPDARSLVRALAVTLYVAIGTYTAWRRPSARFGFYLIGVGLVFSVASLAASDHELPHTIGRIVFAPFSVCLAYVYLAFPHDRLGSRLERHVIAGVAIATVAVWAVTVPLVRELPAAGPLTDCRPNCPANAFQVVDTSHAFSSVLGTAANVVTGGGLLAAAALLFAKARAPSQLRQRLVGPLLISASILAVNYVLYSVLRQAGVGGDLRALRIIGIVTAFAVPLAMLVGQIRGRVFAATSLAQLVASVGREPVTPERVQQMLRGALGDPTLRLAFWEPPRHAYVDVEGQALELPADAGVTKVTFVTRNGRDAALVHDASLDEGSGVVEGLGATSLLLLENTALVDELRASRRRIVASAQRERLRLERNLHDGAQQRLFAIQIKLDAARGQVHDDKMVRELDEISGDAAAAVEELRALAHGLYPTVLRERGLPEALHSLAHTASVRVEVVAHGVDRCSHTVEEALYFCALEAIQNATKHAGPGARVTVALERNGEDLEMTVADDGVGFDPAARGHGIGLVSMQDRIGAVGGALDILSSPGYGTTIRAHVPQCWPHGETAAATGDV